MAASTSVQTRHLDVGKQGASLHVALVGPSLRSWLGGQEVQLDSLARCWTGDDSVRIVLVPNNPELPRALARAENIPGRLP